MTRKHFEVLAVAMAHIRPENELSGDCVAWSEAVDLVADTCRSSSRTFDRKRFVAACCDWNTGIRDGRLARAGG